MDKFDRILKKLYKMPEAALSVDEGAIFVLFPFSINSNRFIYQINLFSCSHVNETSSERLIPVVANNLNMSSFRIEKRDWARSR